MDKFKVLENDGYSMMVAELGILVLLGGYAMLKGISQGVERYTEYCKTKKRNTCYEQNAPLCPRNLDFGDDLCSICLEELSDVTIRNIRRLKCNHMFHKECIDRWIWNEKTTCPNCNQDVLHKEMQ
jgi:hypothetical protein